MKQFAISVPVTELSYDELSPEELELVNTAREASHRAYAPYSKFHVGAAVRLDNGVVVKNSPQAVPRTPIGSPADSYCLAIFMRSRARTSRHVNTFRHCAPTIRAMKATFST